MLKITRNSGICKTEPTEFCDIFYNKQTDEFHFGAYSEDDDIWLPMQDSLQNMLDKNIIYYLEHKYGIYKIVLNYVCDSIIFRGPSPEICYISAVMKTKFNKKWSDSHWHLY